MESVATTRVNQFNKTLETLPKYMITESASAGYFRSESWQKDNPRIQILTIEGLFADKTIEMPPSAYGTFKKAKKNKKQDDTIQLTLGEE